MTTPLVSILTPFKNTSAFLDSCLDSIKNQTYTNWELLIVDDRSNDNSYEIVQGYADQDSRINLLRNDGRGIIDALRTAFTISKGKLITRMDSDDIMMPNKLEAMVKDLTSSGAGHIALGLVKYFKEGEVNDGYRKYEKWLNKLTSIGENYTEIYKECVIPSPCWMVHREDILACQDFKPDIYPEDYDLAFRFYEKNLICLPSTEYLHMWRDYPTRTSRTHIHYAQNSFLGIKIRYFLKLEHDKKRELCLWGAGSKGKIVAQQLIKNRINFTWICDNPKKIGKDIYGITLQDFNKLQEIINPQSIITVANEEAQNDIREYFQALNKKPVQDYFFFC